jgi:hypothetical protein
MPQCIPNQHNNKINHENGIHKTQKKKKKREKKREEKLKGMYFLMELVVFEMHLSNYSLVFTFHLGI